MDKKYQKIIFNVMFYISCILVVIGVVAKNEFMILVCIISALFFLYIEEVKIINNGDDSNDSN
jgi:hypothetical protein